MSIKAVKRMASDILKCGESRLVMNSSHLEEIEKAITKDDVRILIRKKYVWALPKKGVPRARGKIHAERKRKGRSSGIGSRRGTSKARLSPKRVWMAKVRAQRRLLKELKLHGALVRGYRDTYNKIKGGSIRDKSHLITFLKERGYLKEGYEKKS
ncbi:MAG: 50S ribosomal protein L19e [Candidatus Micrarchaeia archaeon]